MTDNKISPRAEQTHVKDESQENIAHSNHAGQVAQLYPDAATGFVTASATAPVHPNDQLNPHTLPEAPARPVVGRVAVVIGEPAQEKSVIDAYLLAMPLGLIGMHNFYLRRYGFGVVYLFTFGLLGVGFLADLIRMPLLVARANKKRLTADECEQKSLCDAYVLWFPLGLLGFHHFYLGRKGWGVLYLFTFGLLGVGWLVDCFLMPRHVRNTNARLQEEYERGPVEREKRLCVAYAWAILGLFGAHHYYLERWPQAIYYNFSFGGFGIGWLIDLCRMKSLVDRVNAEMRNPELRGQKYLDDAYLFAFPAGFLGLHHHYLNRPVWGLIYLCTLGCFGLGFLVDLVRLPLLVTDANLAITTKKSIRQQIHNELGIPHHQAVSSTRHSYLITPNEAPCETSPIIRTVNEMQPPSYDSVFASGYSATGAINRPNASMPAKNNEYI